MSESTSTLIRDPAERQRRAAAKRAVVLRWLRDEGWSTLEVLRELLGLRSRQAVETVIKRLVEAGEARTGRHDGIGGGHVTLVGLTPHGRLMSFAPGEPVTDGPIYEPSRVAEITIPHQLGLQRARLRAERAGWGQWVRGEALEAPYQRPDALVTAPDGRRVAVEYERRAKTPKRYRDILAGHLRSIREGRWDEVHYLCPDDLAGRLRGLFRSLEYISAGGTKVALTDRHLARFAWFDEADWPPPCDEKPPLSGE